MRNYEKQILFVFFLSLTLVTSAKQRTEQELQNAARQFLLGKDAHRMEAMNRSSIKAIIKDSQLTIFDGSNGKCVIVANDDIFKPILGYTDSPFSQTDMAPAFNGGWKPSIAPWSKCSPKARCLKRRLVMKISRGSGTVTNHGMEPRVSI